ncbi:alpha/beta fold hydrolase [bacterium]|nr:alpha/beta fold hydrolase [bacterium]MCB9476428.1 alpha/beta fold hydrolase [Deltaproteobacteria bacterium]MCB9478403.1 alpha/beta fold hydrolase [Deltaproteobacteria bacterium]
MKRTTFFEMFVRLAAIAVTAIGLIAMTNASARAEAKPEDVRIDGADGLKMGGTYYPGQAGKPGLILLHMLSRTREDWRGFALEAQQKGYHVLALDLRGHGASNRLADGTHLDGNGMPNSEFQKMPDDVAAAVQWLRTKKVAEDRIGLVGASVGANAALVAAAKPETNIRALVLLSPGTNYKGIETLSAAETYTGPAFMATGNNDRNAFISTKKLEKVMGERATVKYYDGLDHGNFLFNANRELEPLVFQWLVDHLDS